MPSVRIFLAKTFFKLSRLIVIAFRKRVCGVIVHTKQRFFAAFSFVFSPCAAMVEKDFLCRRKTELFLT